VLEVLKPIWNSKPNTAKRLRGRIEAVLDAARAKGHIPASDANCARWRGIEHRVPLSDRAVEILGIMAKATGTRSDFVFPGIRADRHLSPAACAQQLRRMKVRVTVHGFRSSFRDWCGDQTAFPREIAALSHLSGDQIERSYRRGDALQKRRRLMDAWASYCSKAPSPMC
jgi:integrase